MTTDPAPLPYTDYLAAAAAEFASVIESADPTAIVPSCPGWTIADLAEHLTGVHRWALETILEAELPALDDRLSTADRFRAGADELLRVLREFPPDFPCTTLYPPAILGTWARRQALETTIHLWDAANAVGRGIRIDPALAADGVAEVADDLYPRQVGLRRMPPLETSVQFAMNDAIAAAELYGAESPLIGAVVVGRASDILLLLWGRVGLSDVDVNVSGDTAAVRAMLAAPIVP